MTAEELREEMRNLRGDPQLIARRRSLSRQFREPRLASSVAQADVVITAAGELAVAIRYKAEAVAPCSWRKAWARRENESASLPRSIRCRSLSSKLCALAVRGGRSERANFAAAFRCRRRDTCQNLAGLTDGNRTGRSRVGCSSADRRLTRNGVPGWLKRTLLLLHKLPLSSRAIARRATDTDCVAQFALHPR